MAGAKVVGGVHQLIGADEVAKRVREIGRQITKDYAGRDPVLIGVLRGAMVFLSDLIRNVDVPGVQMDFIKTSSYAGAEHKGVSLVKDVEVDLKDRHVILVEDIVDTGLTLKHLLGHLATKLAASLAVCALLDKPARRMTDVRIDYVGFQIPDEFVVGYGLDYNEQYRNLPFVGYIKPEEPKFEPQR
ncbi:MAG: hypoxanthine phosphoribosyltransferase [SAR202 cluster bacterium]|nr:hypoxanthine phosphoribosyltransferase [SAR202 cluster bacterium]